MRANNYIKIRARAGQPGVAVAPGLVEQPNRRRRKTTTTPPPPADTTFLFPRSGIVTERLEVVRRRRSQQRSPPCSVVINVRLHREEESIQSPPGREDGEAIDRRWSNGSYKIRQQRGQFDRQREVDRVRRRCYGAVGARN